VRIEWSPAARASARRYMADQGGMHAVSVAVAALAADPNPPEAFTRGDYRRLRVGRYRIMYVVEDDLITIERVDRTV
jgi:mRNA-degrading endonuclease RelE of RelBE toxin-antitoxin system